MNWDWEKERLNKQKKINYKQDIIFYNWLKIWYKKHEKHTRIISSKFEFYNNHYPWEQVITDADYTYRVNFCEKDKIHVCISSYDKDDTDIPELVIVNDQISNEEVSRLKDYYPFEYIGLSDLGIDSYSMNLMVFLCILYNDWLNKDNEEMWFLNSFDLKYDTNEKIITIEKLIEVCDNIFNYSGNRKIDLNFLGSHGYIIRSLSKIIKNIDDESREMIFNYKLIPPEWFKLLISPQLDDTTSEPFKISPNVPTQTSIKPAKKKYIYKIVFEYGSILLNDKIHLSKPNFDSENEVVMQFLIKNPNRKITKEEIEKKIDRVIVKSFHKIVENLGFTGNTRKTFFKISKTTILFRNPITEADFNKLGIPHLKIKKK